MIEIKEDDFIIGVWMVERHRLGKVYIYFVKGNEPNEYIGYIRYVYEQQRYNIYMCDNDYRNTFTKKNISELDMIRLCNDKASEMHIMFCHGKEKVLISGGIDKYKEIMEKTPWLPPIVLFPQSKLKEEKNQKKRKKGKSVLIG